MGMFDSWDEFKGSVGHAVANPWDWGMTQLTGGISAVDIGASMYGLGGILNPGRPNNSDLLNAQLQREFAQNGIRWRVEDAKRAGISPLAALGAPGAQASPSFVGDTGPSMSDNLAAAGQGIHRAISATRTAEEQMAAKLNLAMAQADLDGKLIDNQIRNSQLQRLTTPTAFPGSENFMPGQGNSGLLKTKPQERTASRPGSPHMEPGALNSVGYIVGPRGELVPVASADAKERLEDSPGEIMHYFKNNIMPNFGYRGSAPDEKHSWDYINQGWRIKSKHEKAGIRFGPQKYYKEWGY